MPPLKQKIYEKYTNTKTSFKLCENQKKAKQNEISEKLQLISKKGKDKYKMFISIS